MTSELGFVPLKRRSGIFAGEFVRKFADRGLVIWGAGVLGRCLMNQLKPYVAVTDHLYFADSSQSLVGSTVDGCRVLSVEDALRLTKGKQVFLLVALAAHTQSAMKHAEEFGLKEGLDYESYRKLSRPEAVVQVAAHDDSVPTLMSLNRYCAILTRLKSDIPDLFHIDLSGWGDPICHPELPAIIEATRRVVPCTVTTRLVADASEVERVLLAEPTQFVILADDKRNAEFFDRLRRVVMLRDRLGGRTEIRVKYVRYLDNEEGLTQVREHCNALGLKLVEALGYIDPYDTVLELLETGDLLTHDAKRLVWPLRRALDLALIDRDQACLCQRIFPVINTDGSVGVCHLYTQPRLHGDYLALSYNSVQDLRENAANCRKCQYHALHRLDVEVLQARHSSILA